MANEEKKSQTNQKEGLKVQKEEPSKQSMHSQDQIGIVLIVGAVIIIVAMVLLLFTITPTQIEEPIINNSLEEVQEEPTLEIENQNETLEEESVVEELELSQIEQELIDAINEQRVAYSANEYVVNMRLFNLTKKFHMQKVEEGAAIAKDEHGSLVRRARSAGLQAANSREVTSEVPKEDIANGKDLFEAVEFFDLYQPRFTELAVSVIETETEFDVVINIVELELEE